MHVGDEMYDSRLHADERRGCGYSHAERRSWRRQAGAMMSPSLAHKLWLTLWGLEGKEMEWNENAPSLCWRGGAGRKDERRSGDGGRRRRPLESLRLGEGHTDTVTRGSKVGWRGSDFYDSANLRGKRWLLSITWDSRTEKKKGKIGRMKPEIDF